MVVLGGGAVSYDRGIPVVVDGLRSTPWLRWFQMLMVAFVACEFYIVYRQVF